MGTIFLLGLAAAVYPQLLAVVVVILTRPDPKPLLWACYLGSVLVSVGCGVAILAVFRSRGTIAGTSAQRLGPAAYLVLGAIGLALAAFAATPRGRGLLGVDVPRALKRGTDSPPASGSVKRLRSKAERALKQGSLPVAAAVGATLGVPGPFDLLALGRIARGPYATVAAGALIVAFNLTKFVLIELPIVSYAIRPERTASAIERFSRWMKTYRLEVIAGVAAVVSIVLIGRGVSGLS